MYSDSYINPIPTDQRLGGLSLGKTEDYLATCKTLALMRALRFQSIGLPRRHSWSQTRAASEEACGKGGGVFQTFIVGKGAVYFIHYTCLAASHSQAA